MAKLELNYQYALPTMESAVAVSPKVLEHFTDFTPIVSKYFGSLGINDVLLANFIDGKIDYCFGTEHNKKSKLLLLINFDGAIDIDGRTNLLRFLEKMKPSLQEKSPFIVRASTGDNFDFDSLAFKSLVWEAGFNSPKIITNKLPPRHFLLMGFKKADRRYIDLTDKDSKNYERLKRLWSHMSQEYRKNGWKIIDAKDSKLLERLKHTHYPKFEYELLKRGFGVKVEGRCGCVYSINTSGAAKKLQECFTDNCLGEPVFNPIFEYRKKEILKETITVDDKNIYRLGEEVPTNEKCFCGEHFVKVWVDCKKLPRGWEILQQTVYCPHDGYTEEVVKQFPPIKIKVPLKNVVVGRKNSASFASNPE